MSNILERANKIVNERAEEKERQYGPFHESLKRAASIYNELRPLNCPAISAEAIYWIMISLKLSREAYSHKEDNLLDAAAYMGALNNYLEDEDYKK